MFSFKRKLINKLEETVYDSEAETLFCKTTRLNNAKNDVLLHNRFNNFLVLIFSFLNKAQMCKNLYRDGPHHQIEKLMSFNYFTLLKTNEHKEDYYIRKPNGKNYLYEIEETNYIYVGENIVNFETIDRIVTYSSDLSFNDIRIPNCLQQKNNYLIFHQKFFLFHEKKLKQKKTSSTISIKK